VTPALETRFAHKQEEEEKARKREKFGRAGRRRGFGKGGEELDWRRRRRGDSLLLFLQVVAPTGRHPFVAYKPASVSCLIML